MKNINYYLFIFIIIFFHSCKDKQTKDIEELFPEKHTIQGKLVNFPNNKIGNLFNIEVIDSLFITQDSPDKNYLINIFNIHKEKFLKNAIRKGRGPNEFIMGFINYNGIGREFDLFTPVERALYKFNIDSLLKGSYSPKKIRNFKSDSGSTFNVLNIGDTLFVGNGYYSDKWYALMDQERIIQKFGEFPKDKHKSPPAVKAMAYQGQLKIKPDYTKFLFFTHNAGIIEIYKIHQQFIKPLIKLHFHYPKYRAVYGGPNRGKGAGISSKSKTGFTDISVTDSLIFALYSGRTWQKYRKMKIYSNNILVFNWQGKPIKRYYIANDSYLISVTKNKNKKGYTMYTSSLGPHGEEKIYKYQLK